MSRWWLNFQSLRRLLISNKVFRKPHSRSNVEIIKSSSCRNKSKTYANCNIQILRDFSTSRRLLLKKAGSHDQPCATFPVALVLGIYLYDNDLNREDGVLTPSGEKFNSLFEGKVMSILKDGAMPIPKLGEVRVIYGLSDRYSVVVVAGVGDPCQCYNPIEQIDEKKEAVRIAVAAGCRAAQVHNLKTIYVDTMDSAESAAEGAALAIWMYQELKDPAHQKKVPKIIMFDSCDESGWTIGLHKAAAQNVARFLTESPGNQLTPSLFTSTAVEMLSKCGINVNVRMKHWAELRNLNAFLAVGKGSCEEPVFLEALYEGCDPDICPAIIIGKGVTFDAGGLCLRKCKDLEHARGDMSGAAIVVAVLRAVAALQLPINVRGFIPLCENLPGAAAIHPGSVVRNVSGKSLLIRNTDDEGILMLADALSYAKEFKPKFIIDIGNYTPQGRTAMGSVASIAFSNSESLLETLRIASIHTGDRIWRFPLWRYFGEYLTRYMNADLQNIPSAKDGGGVCKAAAFLNEFITGQVDWIHIDTYGVNVTSGNVYPYLREGMSGRPTRTIVEFFAQLACNIERKGGEGKCG